MAVNLSPVGGVAAQFFTSTGAVLTGGKLYTYLAGTTTPAVTYTTSQGTIPWANPVVLDAAGRVSGSGEIWLTDGIIYKFVLKDSNDVLIATYDNITGINSNAVAYTNQQEIVTATAGQTVFNLGISYQPGTNSLSVFVDGVNQYGPGAQYSYVETDSNTVTFNSGLHVGAEVKFTTTQQQGAGAVDASQVSYDPPFTGSVATNVEVKLAEWVNVKDFGAVGDGVTDDTAAIQTAIDSIPFEGGDIYFPVGEYIISSALEIYDKSRVSLIGQSMPGGDNIGDITGACIVNTGTGYAIDIDSTAAYERRQIALRKLHVRGSSTTDHIVRMSMMNYCVIEDCVFYGADGTNKAGLLLNKVVELWATRLRLQGCYWGVLYDNTGVDYLNATTFLNCDITQNTYGGATIQGQNVNFIGCNFEGQPRGVEIGVLTGLSTRAINLIGCYWEANTVECIRAASNATVTGLTIQGCFFNPSLTASRVAYFGSVNNLVWTGNALNVGVTPTEYVRLNGCDNVFIQDKGLAIGSSLIVQSAVNYSINGVTATDVAPTTYTPTVYAETGSITTYTANGLYTQKGSVITANIRIIISDVGTGSGKCYFTLPGVTFTSTAIAIGVGKETALTDDALTVQTISANNDCYLVKYDGSTALATGATFNVTVTFIV